MNEREVTEIRLAFDQMQDEYQVIMDRLNSNAVISTKQKALLINSLNHSLDCYTTRLRHEGSKKNPDACNLAVFRAKINTIKGILEKSF
jgi:hypothetical protein